MANLDLMLGAAPELPLRTDMGNVPDYVRRCFKDESDCVMLMGLVRKTSIKGLTSNFLAARSVFCTRTRCERNSFAIFQPGQSRSKRTDSQERCFGWCIHLRLCKDASSFEIEVKTGRLIVSLGTHCRTLTDTVISGSRLYKFFVETVSKSSEIMKSAKQKIDLAENEAIGFDEEEMSIL